MGVPDCKGVGCKANGHDDNCVWCIYDYRKCFEVYGKACDATWHARAAQGLNGCPTASSALRSTATCSADESSSGQQQIWVPDCKGVGCKANGHDDNCAWCIYDYPKCFEVYGKACDATWHARAQGMNGCTPANSPSPSGKDSYFVV